MENKTIVADYIDMPAKELRSDPFVRAKHNRRVQRLTGRLRGSIEYKHQNISAVMRESCLPYIRGYLPAENYQHSLFGVIADRL